MTAPKLQNQKRIGFSTNFSRVVSRSRYTFTVLLLLFALTISPQDNASVGSTKKVPQAPLILLESSEGAINPGSSAGAIALSATDGQVLYAVDRSTEEVVVHETQLKSSGKIKSFIPSQNVASIAVGSEGNIYLADSVSNQVRVMSPTGESLRTVPVARPYALGVLGNGNLVVGSTAGMDLLHLYGPTGSRLLSFGELRLLDNRSHRQNRFLNRGKIAIGPSNTIYYVSRFAPAPTVQKYSSDGQLLSEFAINGDAVDFQRKVANDFLREKGAGQVGGFDVITCATVDPSTDHLWIGMNGTSQAGVVYEYDTSGVKLREYAFVFKGRAGYTDIITGVKDLVVRNNSIYLLTWEGLVYRFSVNNSVSLLPQSDKNQTLTGLLSSGMSSFFAPRSVSATGPLAALQLPCPTAQPQSCVASCRAGSNPTTKDCAAELASHKGTDEIIIGGSCSNSAGPEPSCSASANFCNTTNGNRNTISTSLTCSAPPPPPGGGDDECEQGCPPDTVCYEGLCSYCSPILVDVSGSGFNLTDVAGGIDFDFNRDKRTEKISWTSASSDNAWLVLDRNGNGLIDDGTELFGNLTPQPMSANPNGFIALAEFDKPENGGNGDRRIDRRDAIFSSLRLWQDANHNGVSEPAELRTPQALGVKAFDLVYKQSRRVDQFGNEFRYGAKVYDKRGGSVGKWAWDVYLRKGS
jgi:hypothetical protein